MNLKALRAFQLIVEGGSLTAASKNLGLSQPAVSRLVSLLEGELKLLLFNRTGRALRVTEEGAAFYVATRHILAGLGEIPRIAKDIQASDKQLKLVTTPRIAQGLISPAVRRLRHVKPKLNCKIDVLSRFDLDNLVGLRRFDLAIASLPVTHALVELENHPLFRVRLEAVMRKDHRLASRKRVTAADLAGEEPPWALGGSALAAADERLHARGRRNRKLRRRDPLISDGVPAWPSTGPALPCSIG